MRAVVITKHGGPGVLEVQERPDPELGPGEVRIAVAAAGVNFADVMARMGLYPEAPKPACVIGYEVAGTILELGEGVQGLEPRRARDGGYDVRRLRLAGRRARGRCRRAARPHDVRAGRSDPAQLRHGVGRADRLWEPRGGRAGADPLGGRRGGHRRDADRKAPRRRGLRDRFAGQARAHLRDRRRPPARLHEAAAGRTDSPSST